jgi:hypothetical protein
VIEEPSDDWLKNWLPKMVSTPALVNDDPYARMAEMENRSLLRWWSQAGRPMSQMQL